jgi:hypothetical protein
LQILNLLTLLILSTPTKVAGGTQFRTQPATISFHAKGNYCPARSPLASSLLGRVNSQVEGLARYEEKFGLNLYSLGVKPKVIQAILRHSDISVTLNFYVETPEQESREALDKLTSLMGQST